MGYQERIEENRLRNSQENITLLLRISSEIRNFKWRRHIWKVKIARRIETSEKVNALKVDFVDWGNWAKERKVAYPELLSTQPFCFQGKAKETSLSEWLPRRQDGAVSGFRLHYSEIPYTAAMCSDTRVRTTVCRSQLLWAGHNCSGSVKTALSRSQLLWFGHNLSGLVTTALGRSQLL
ncbi:hypothetical protein J6590_032517 [Homalodisca vitripennis]|nr:hypothetical protein J6590_032517 [Homalodisca vitripennis]